MDASTVGVIFGSLLVIFGSIFFYYLCGRMPYNLGKKYDDEQVGMAGLIVTIICGVLGGFIIAILVSAVFSAIILSRKNKFSDSSSLGDDLD